LLTIVERRIRKKSMPSALSLFPLVSLAFAALYPEEVASTHFQLGHRRPWPARTSGSGSSRPSPASGSAVVRVETSNPQRPVLFSAGGLKNGFQQSHNAGKSRIMHSRTQNLQDEQQSLFLKLADFTWKNRKFCFYPTYTLFGYTLHRYNSQEIPNDIPRKQCHLSNPQVKFEPTSPIALIATYTPFKKNVLVLYFNYFILVMSMQV
jgi:hypothetical protein